MKNLNSLLVSLFIKSLMLALIIFALSCNSNRNADIEDRNSMRDGDDARQPYQDQDSVNKIPDKNKAAADTLPEGLKDSN